MGVGDEGYGFGHGVGFLLFRKSEAPKFGRSVLDCSDADRSDQTLLGGDKLLNSVAFSRVRFSVRLDQNSSESSISP